MIHSWRETSGKHRKLMGRRKRRREVFSLPVFSFRASEEETRKSVLYIKKRLQKLQKKKKKRGGRVWFHLTDRTIERRA